MRVGSLVRGRFSKDTEVGIVVRFNYGYKFDVVVLFGGEEIRCPRINLEVLCK